MAGPDSGGRGGGAGTDRVVAPEGPRAASKTTEARSTEGHWSPLSASIPVATPAVRSLASTLSDGSTQSRRASVLDAPVWLQRCTSTSTRAPGISMISVCLRLVQSGGNAAPSRARTSNARRLGCFSRVSRRRR